MKRKIWGLLLVLCLALLPGIALAADLALDLDTSKENSMEGYKWETSIAPHTHRLTLSKAQLGNLTLNIKDTKHVETIMIVLNEASTINNLEWNKLGTYDVFFELKAGEGKEKSLTINGPVSNSDLNRIKIDAGAKLVLNEGLNIGESGGSDSKLIIEGSLLVKGKAPDPAINCGIVQIASTGMLFVNGQMGVKVNGVQSPPPGVHKMNNAFVIETGGKFIAELLDQEPGRENSAFLSAQNTVSSTKTT